MTEALLDDFNNDVTSKADIDLERFDDYFAYKDQLLEKDFTPASPLTFLRACAVETIKEHIQFLHGLLMPNPKNLIANSQSNALSDDEEDLVSDTIDEYAYLMTRSRQVTLNGGVEAEAAFLDQAITVWEDTRDDYQAILDVVEEHWEEQRNE